jgi:mRNA interferase HigB
MRKGRFASFVELRQAFGSADMVGKLTVFNIGGNKYRLIAAIQFDRGRVYIRHVLTHREYDLNKWKNEL